MSWATGFFLKYKYVGVIISRTILLFRIEKRANGDLIGARLGRIILKITMKKR
ncbi:MAG: hypothetical protein F7C07_00100 [Desulfurococcales archaeon]|nr:hypothetical protein [Desulfurococcales archaeon]